VVGEWHHLVVTYGDVDGSKRSWMQMFYDGELIYEKKGCSLDDGQRCGKIMYPVPAFAVAGTCDNDAPFTIGTLNNTKVSPPVVDPHIGMIKNARVFQRALQDYEVVYLYKIMAPALRSFLIPEGEYWVKGESRFNAASNRWVGAVSPSGDYTYVDKDRSILVRGRFLKTGRNYTCEFRYGDVVHESPPSFIQCTAIDMSQKVSDGQANHGLEVGTLSCDYMVCNTGTWDHGWAAARMRINSYSRDAEGVQQMKPLWQRACLYTVCGFPKYAVRFASLTDKNVLTDEQQYSMFMIQRGTNKQLDTGLVGDMTYFRFLTRTSIFHFNEAAESLERMVDLTAYERSANVFQPMGWVNLTYINANIERLENVTNVTFNPNDNAAWPIRYYPRENHTLLTGRWALKTCSHLPAFTADDTPGVKAAPVYVYHNESMGELFKFHLRRCENDQQCPSGQICQSDDSYRVVGSVQVTPFQHQGMQHMIVANFWDGLTSHVGSAMFRYYINFTGVNPMHSDSSGAVRSLRFVQLVPTRGARRWTHLKILDKSVLLVASFTGPSSAFLLEDAPDMPINVSRSCPVGPAGISSLATFTSGLSTYVVLSALTDGSGGMADSLLLRVGLAHNMSHSDFGGARLQPHDHKFQGPGKHPVTAQVVQTFPTQRAHDVEYFELGDFRYLAFASLSGTSPSVIFRCLKSSATISFTLHQALEVSHATSLHFVPGIVPCLFVGKDQGHSVMLHWNGSVFLGVNNASTASSDAAGGQFFQTYNAQDIVTLRRKGFVASGTGSPILLGELNYTDYLFLGNFGRKELRPRVHDSFVNYAWRNRTRVDKEWSFERVEMELLRGRHDAIFGLDGPMAVQISPLDGRFVYVACYWSRSIVGFHRDVVSGHLVYNSQATLLTAFTHSRITDTNPPDSGPTANLGRRLTPERFGAPLRSMHTMTMSPDQKNLYVTSFGDDRVSVFSVDQLTGALDLVQEVRNGDVHGGRSINAMRRPSAVAVSVRGESVYITGWLDQAVSVFERAQNGSIIYLDRVRNGERMLSWYHDNSKSTLIPASVLSAPMTIAVNHTAEDYLPTEYPMRLGGSIHPTWHLTSRDTKSFVISGEHFLAVAASDKIGSTISVNNVTYQTWVGGAVIYKWNKLKGLFTEIQNTTLDPAANSVVHFEIPDRTGGTFHFIAVANAYHGEFVEPTPLGTVNVYRWSTATQRFVLYHTLDQGDLVSMMTSLSVRRLSNISSCKTARTAWR